MPAKIKRKINSPNHLIEVYLDRSDTASKSESFALTLPVGSQQVPEHYHEKLEELFLITEGEVKFIVSGESFIAKAGDFIPVQRGTLHGFGHHGEIDSKMWVTTVGEAGLLDYLKEVSDILNADLSESEKKQKISALFDHYDAKV